MMKASMQQSNQEQSIGRLDLTLTAIITFAPSISCSLFAIFFLFMSQQYYNGYSLDRLLVKNHSELGYIIPNNVKINTI